MTQSCTVPDELCVGRKGGLALKMSLFPKHCYLRQGNVCCINLVSFSGSWREAKLSKLGMQAE